MSVRYATAFSGLTRIAPAATNGFNYAESWKFMAFDALTFKSYGTSNAQNIYGKLGIVADTITSSRNNLRHTYANNNSGGELVTIIPPAATTSSANDTSRGMILGFTFSCKMDSTAAVPAANSTAPQRFGVAVATTDCLKSSSSPMKASPENKCFLVLGDGPADGVAKGWPLAVYGRNVFSRPSSFTDTYEFGAVHHVELVCEKQSKRIRAYVNGTLVQDITYENAIEDVINGLAIWLWRDGSYSSSYTFHTDVTGIYVLNIDDTHPERLGPAARVVEYTPYKDIQAGFTNTNDGKPNYSTASQMLDGASEYSLIGTDEGSTDLYGISPQVRSDAVKIFGAAVKFRAADISGSSSEVGGVIGNGEKVNEGARYKVSSAPATFVSDASVNPITGKLLTVADAPNIGLGIRGYKK